MLATLGQILLFTIGLVVLALGAKWMVQGATDLAIRIGVKPIVVGLTVVAFGTSAPELVVSLMAVVKSPEIAIGNVIGSNIANVGLIAGLTALIVPIATDRSFLRIDMPFLFVSMIVLALVSLDGIISRLDALALLVLLVLFNVGVYMTSSLRGIEDEVKLKTGPSLAKAVFGAMVGLVGLTIGAKLMVDSAVYMARSYGISELVIGATIVAIGTSLPELATSLVAVLKKQAAIGLGNVIGSNVFNICSILGIAPLLKELPVSNDALFYQYPIMIGFSVALALMLLKRSNRITRPEGAVLFISYLVFLAWCLLTGTATPGN